MGNVIGLSLDEEKNAGFANEDTGFKLQTLYNPILVTKYTILREDELKRKKISWFTHNHAHFFLLSHNYGTKIFFHSHQAAGSFSVRWCSEWYLLKEWYFSITYMVDSGLMISGMFFSH